MISGIIRRALPLLQGCKVLSQLTHIQNAGFSRAAKFNEFKEVLDK